MGKVDNWKGTYGQTTPIWPISSMNALPYQLAGISPFDRHEHFVKKAGYNEKKMT